MQSKTDHSQRLTPKQCRLLAGLNQPELAALAKVDTKTVHRIENGTCKNPSPVILEKIGLAIEKRSRDRNLLNDSLPLVSYRDYVLSLGA